MVHLNGLDFSGHVSRSKHDDHTGLDSSGFNTSDGHRTNTADLVDILEGKSKRLVGRTLRRLNGIDGVQQGLTLADTGFGLSREHRIRYCLGGWWVVVVNCEYGNEPPSAIP